MLPHPAIILYPFGVIEIRARCLCYMPAPFLLICGEGVEDAVVVTDQQGVLRDGR